MLSDLAVWYLRKRNKSVMIGHELNEGKVRALNEGVYIYDNTIGEIEYRMHNNYPVPLILDTKYQVTVKKR